jgi:hypothetical protein
VSFVPLEDSRRFPFSYTPTVSFVAFEDGRCFLFH